MGNVDVGGNLSLDIMEKRVMDRLDQNHRILRYLHEWSDNLPLNVLRNHINNAQSSSDFEAEKNSYFGISISSFHILLVVLLTFCLIIWDSNNQQMDIFNATLQFLNEVYFVIIRQVLPQSVLIYEDVIFQFAQDTINQTNILTQNILSAIK